ncbi:DNA polymerase III subunit delta' [Synechocystis sp. LKSZ1]|uniref:DNA polymerase III subunit delta' n=1 Tax=Synechocystis sp. LKSZ1 TaxID=3144951 RepID=UPI00336BF3B9
MSQFQGLIGQPQAVELLQRALVQNRIAPAYLFVGPEGVGKGLAAKLFTAALLSRGQVSTSQASITQRFLGGNHPDLLWLEPTYQHQGKLLTAAEAEQSGLKRRAPPLIRIEQIREISRFLSRPPLEAEQAVVVISTAQAMNEGAANALLKTLEEPGRATLILLAPSLDALLPTLVSRCQRIPFYRLGPAALSQVLESLGHGALMAQPELVGLAQGSPGLMLQAWEQAQALPPGLEEQLRHPPSTALAALTLAKTLEQSLDLPLQLWLVDYLQWLYWHRDHQPCQASLFEAARQQLLAYVQPRLVWECTLLALLQGPSHQATSAKT